MDNDTTTTGNDHHGALPNPHATDRVTANTAAPSTRRVPRKAMAAGGAALAALFLFSAFHFFGVDDQPEWEDAAATSDQVTAEADARRDRLTGAVDDDLLVIGSRDDDSIDGLDDDVIRGDGERDELFGDAGDDELPGASADLLRGSAEDGEPNPGAAPVVEPYVQELCVNVRHREVEGQDSASGIWVNGSVYGLSADTWIWVEGPTINGGQPVQIPVRPDGTFDGGLGINQYGDHEITRFGLWDGRPGSDPSDLLPGVTDQFGQPRIPVGPNEGAAFDQECFRIDPPTPADPVAAGESADAPGEDPALMDQAIAFFEGFVADHRAGDVDHLVDTLHPAIPMAFGDDTCTRYVERTVGSITDATVLGASGPGEFELDTPGGPIGFPEVIDVEVEMTLADGTTQISDVHLPFHDGTPYWLTTCGWDAP